MGLLGKVLPIFSTDPTSEISKILPIADCAAECSIEDCYTKFPSSLKIEKDSPLWGSARPHVLHILIATGSKDWSHSVTDSSSLAAAVDKWGGILGKKLAGGTVKISASSISPPKSTFTEEFDKLPAKERPGVVLILPYMVKLENITPSNAASVLTKVMENLNEMKQKQSQKTPEMPNIIDGVTITKVKDKAIVLLCSHRTRDKRCGITAPLMKKEFDIHLRDNNLYRDSDDETPGGVNVYFVSHIGGHKFSANVMIYLDSGKSIWMARCTPRNAKPIVEHTILQNGEVWPELVRSASTNKVMDW